MAEKNKPSASAEIELTSLTASGTAIRIQWIRIVKDGGAKRLFFAGFPTGSTSLTGGYFDTNHSSFNTWFSLLLASFNSTDASPVYVTFTTDITSRRNYTYYEQISWPPYTPPEFPAYTSLSHPLTLSLT